mgnify:FL=1|jgi:hypothetical protein
MKVKCYILLLILSSCFSSEEPVEEIKSFNTNLDSLFNSADQAVEQVNSRKEQKTLLEQDLWRKKRDIKNLHIKVDAYHDSMFEMSELRMGDDSVQYNYKIVLQTIIDTVRISITDTICSVCETKQNKRDNRWYKKTFKWIKNI